MISMNEHPYLCTYVACRYDLSIGSSARRQRSAWSVFRVFFSAQMSKRASDRMGAATIAQSIHICPILG
jgi:tetrahydromethanopterin S-methyltransferase subunit H